MRRIWAWSNRLIPSIFLFFILPISMFYLVSLPLKNIIRFSLSEIPYDIWVLPGLLFIIGSFSIYPSIYRDYFEHRLNNKVLVNISLAPYSKRIIIFSTLVTSLVESFVMIFISIIIYSIFTPFILDIPTFIFLFLCLSIYLFILGNFFIFLSIWIDVISIMFLTFLMVFVLIFFGSGFLFELSFFPIVIESILIWSPFSISFQIFQKFNSTSIIDWTSIFCLIILNYLMIIVNSYLLKQKLQQ